MASISSYSPSTSSNFPASLSAFNNQSFPSSLRCSVTIIVQPPSPTHKQQSSLLIKRRNPAEFGDMLMKKIKSRTFTSDDDFSQQSPLQDNSEENAFYSSNIEIKLEADSMVEEAISPSSKSDSQKFNVQKILGGITLPQKNLSTSLLLSKPKAKDSQKQIQEALEVLQKKMLIDQHMTTLREAILKTQLSQESLCIPPLMPSSHFSEISKNHQNGLTGKGFLNDNEDEPKIMYGPVEYPFLSMSTPLFGNDKTSLLNLDNVKMPTNSLLDSLCVTRAETQKSESDGASPQEESSQGKKKEN